MRFCRDWLGYTRVVHMNCTKLAEQRKLSFKMMETMLFLIMTVVVGVLNLEPVVWTMPWTIPSASVLKVTIGGVTSMPSSNASTCSSFTAGLSLSFLSLFFTHVVFFLSFLRLQPRARNWKPWRPSRAPRKLRSQHRSGWWKSWELNWRVCR